MNRITSLCIDNIKDYGYLTHIAEESVRFECRLCYHIPCKWMMKNKRDGLSSVLQKIRRKKKLANILTEIRCSGDWENYLFVFSSLMLLVFRVF